MHSFAQTNIQLFNQLRRDGYSNSELDCIFKAYNLAMELFTGQFRGSGKTFIAHLVGTASILGSLRVPIKVVAAGLLHAAYMNGDFGDRTFDISDRKRAQVRSAVGRGVEDYVARYTALEWNDTTILSMRDRIAQLNQIYRDLLLIRLAEELEDHLDNGVFYCSNVEQRRQYINQNGNLLVEIAERMGFPTLAAELTRLQELTAEVPIESDCIDANRLVFSQHSFTILPNSTKPQLISIEDSILPQVTIVVVPRERFSHSERSLENLYANTTCPFKLIYVDNNSPLQTKSYLEAQALQRGFHLIRTEHFLSPNQARNLALKQVNTKYVVFIDNDVLVKPNWLESLVQCAEETQAGIVGPLYLIGEPQLELIHMAGGICHLNEEKGDRSLYYQHSFEDKLVSNLPFSLRRSECEIAEFHCMLVRVEVFEKVVLDEKFMSVGEHIDFCMSVRESGDSIYFEPNAAIAYIPPAAMAASDIPHFLLRWGDEWNSLSVSHFCQKWNLSKNDEVVSKMYNWANNYRKRWLQTYLEQA